MFKHKRGQWLVDVVTGFEGVVVSRQDHLAGCNRYFLQPKVSDDGKLPDGYWFDEPCLEPIPVTSVTLARDPGPPG